MSDTFTTTPGAAGTIDISNSTSPSFLTTTLVEARKLVDTASAKWLLIFTFLGTALVIGITLIVDIMNDLNLSFHTFTQAGSFLLSILLPIVSVLLVTSEWGQRTGMNTFTLEPHRAKVIFAKWAASLVVALVAATVALALAAGAAGIASAAGQNTSWDYSISLLAGFYALQLLAVTAGFAMGCLFLNAAAAIILYLVYIFVLPTIINVVGVMVGFFRDIAPWIDFQSAQEPLLTGERTTSLPSTDMSVIPQQFTWGETWAHLAVAGFIWLVIPTVIGLIRILKAEVK